MAADDFAVAVHALKSSSLPIDQKRENLLIVSEALLNGDDGCGELTAQLVTDLAHCLCVLGSVMSDRTAPADASKIARTILCFERYCTAIAKRVLLKDSVELRNRTLLAHLMQRDALPVAPANPIVHRHAFRVLYQTLLSAVVDGKLADVKRTWERLFDGPHRAEAARYLIRATFDSDAPQLSLVEQLQRARMVKSMDPTQLAALAQGEEKNFARQMLLAPSAEMRASACQHVRHFLGDSLRCQGRFVLAAAADAVEQWTAHSDTTMAAAEATKAIRLLLYMDLQVEQVASGDNAGAAVEPLQRILKAGVLVLGRLEAAPSASRTEGDSGTGKQSSSNTADAKVALAYAFYLLFSKYIRHNMGEEDVALAVLTSRVRGFIRALCRVALPAAPKELFEACGLTSTVGSVSPWPVYGPIAAKAKAWAQLLDLRLVELTLEIIAVAGARVNVLRTSEIGPENEDLKPVPAVSEQQLKLLTQLARWVIAELETYVDALPTPDGIPKRGRAGAGPARVEEQFVESAAAAQSRNVLAVSVHSRSVALCALMAACPDHATFRRRDVKTCPATFEQLAVGSANGSSGAADLEYQQRRQQPGV